MCRKESVCQDNPCVNEHNNFQIAVLLLFNAVKHLPEGDRIIRITEKAAPTFNSECFLVTAAEKHADVRYCVQTNYRDDLFQFSLPAEQNL